MIKKAVFPVAGLGTRFLPATKASPKEMLPVVDKPLIQYAVEEAVAAGITEMIFVTGRSKRAIEDHFDKAYELENELMLRQKYKMLDFVQHLLPRHIQYVFIRQQEALGLGHAVLCAQPVVGRDDFAVLLADDLLDSEPGVLKQMLEIYKENPATILAVQDVPRAETNQYGIAQTEKITDKNLGNAKKSGDSENGVNLENSAKTGNFGKAENSAKAVNFENVERVTALVEKPEPEAAPSTLGVVGRYVLSGKIFDYLKNVKPGTGGEIQLTDAIAELLKNEPVLAYRYQGTRYDCGSKLGYLKATVTLGQRHDEIGQDFKDWLKLQKFV